MRRKILLVEDDPTFRKAIIYAFRKEYSFEEATTVSEGLRILDDNQSIQVIILDLELPGSEGATLLKRIKENASRYRVIVLTAHDELLSPDKADELDVFVYLPKASKNSLKPLRFAINQAFKDIGINEHIKIQEVINANRSLEEILNLICKYTLERIGGYTCHIRLFELKKGDYGLIAYDGPDNVRSVFSPKKRIREAFSGKVANKNTPEMIPDLQNHPEFKQMKEQVLNSSDVTKEAVEYLNTVRSAYIVPISTGVFENEVDAVLNISSEAKDYFTADKCKIVDDFVTQVNLAIAKDWLRNKREEVHEDYSRSSNLLVQISEQLKGENILENIYRIVIDGIVEIINPEMISIFLYNERSALLEKVAEKIGKDDAEDLAETYSSGESLTGKVFEFSRITRINNNPTQHPDYDASSREIDLMKLPSRQIDHYLGVPLRTGNKTIGVIRTVNKKSGYYDELDDESIQNDDTCLLKRGFSKDCQTVLSIIASHLSVAIKNAELFNKLSGRINQLQTLTQVARRVSSNYEMEIDGLLELIVRKTAEVTNSVICMLFLKDEYDENRVVLKQAYGISKSKIEGIFYELGKGKTGEVALTGESKLEIQAEKNHVGKYDELTLEALRETEGPQARIESFMAVPIIVGDTTQVSRREIIGVLKVINKKQDHLPFDKDDIKVFETFASQIGLAVAIAERNYALSQLVGGVCHEINNTSTLIPPTINRTKELLVPIDPEVDKRLTRIYILAKEAAEFANDLLGFSESQMQERQLVDINQLVDEALEYIPPDTVSIVNYHQVIQQKKFSETPIFCNVYKTPFIHVVRNIVVNAYHAMEGKEGRLEISTSIDPTGAIAHIKFADNGHGIKKEHLHKIYRSDFSTKKGLKGNGLGLWLVKTYLHRMGGSISVVSNPGQGAAFTMRIPTFQQGELTNG
jgi:signal transduction histidine kinase/CheY-like chemotaxis protein